MPVLGWRRSICSTAARRDAISPVFRLSCKSRKAKSFAASLAWYRSSMPVEIWLFITPISTCMWLIDDRTHTDAVIRKGIPTVIATRDASSIVVLSANDLTFSSASSLACFLDCGISLPATEFGALGVMLLDLRDGFVRVALRPEDRRCDSTECPNRVSRGAQRGHGRAPAQDGG
jgi:hypothetical protein